MGKKRAQKCGQKCGQKTSAKNERKKKNALEPPFPILLLLAVCPVHIPSRENGTPFTYLQWKNCISFRLVCSRYFEGLFEYLNDSFPLPFSILRRVKSLPSVQPEKGTSLGQIPPEKEITPRIVEPATCVTIRLSTTGCQNWMRLNEI